ncbi:MAG TPA: YceI family protein [Blastocatellia bacterium]|jgi:polyisoprenoid-binding protein YceI|nr:YceI family protein [Blastocatellia bacterium]
MLKRYTIVAVMMTMLAVVALGSTRYGIDTNHSNVSFSVPIMDGLARVTGKFTDFTIDIDYDESDITKSSVKAVIKAASIDTGIDKRDAHLRTPDFFDAEKFPEITFESKRIEKKGGNLFAHGTFTMHGVSKEITLPFTIKGPAKNPDGTPGSMGFSTRLVLNRQDYGISYKNKNVPNFLGDNIEVTIDLITRPEKKQ